MKFAIQGTPVLVHSYNEAMVGAVRKRLLFIALLAVSFAVAFAI